MTRTTQMVEVGKCIPSKFQHGGRSLREIDDMIRSLKENGQLTPIVVVRDGDCFQMAMGHRRLEAAKRAGIKWLEAHVTEDWDDADVLCRALDENCSHEPVTAGEKAHALQTGLQLGVPVTRLAAGARMDTAKVRDFARGAMRVPDADATASFDALVAVGENRDVLDDADVDAVMSAASPWRREEVIRAAKGRAAARELEAELESHGVRVVGRGDLAGRDMRRCREGEQAQGVVAVVDSDYWGEAEAVYYCEREQGPESPAADASEPGAAGTGAACAPSPEEVEAQRRFRERVATARDLDSHVAEFARRAHRKFPSGRGHSRLRAWAHSVFDEHYGCRPDAGWAGVREQKSAALDRFILMRTVPQCLPTVPEGALRDVAVADAREAEQAAAFLRFHEEVMAFAGYKATEGEEGLFAHLRSVLGIEPEPEQPEPATRPIINLAEHAPALAAAA